MTYCVARAVQQVKASIPKVIECWELSNLDISIESDLSKFSVHLVAFPDGRIRIGRITRQHRVFESLTDNKIDIVRKRRGIPDVIPMPVTPDDSFDAAWLYTIRPQDFEYILRHLNVIVHSR